MRRVIVNPNFEARYVDFLFEKGFSIAARVAVEAFLEFPGVCSEVQAVIRYARWPR